MAAVTAAVLAACGGPAEPTAAVDRPLVVGAVPDQDADRLQEIYGATADRLARDLDRPVQFRPVTDYAAAVSQFRTGDLDLVWFGGLTGVQARLQTPGAVPLVQRDIDDQFRSVFIASSASGLQPVQDAGGLSELAGTRFTFGSRSSTSGLLMPASFLLDAGVDPETGFAGRPGYSGSHDATVDLVESGSYEAGVLNEQVWDERLEAGTVDTDAVTEIWRSEPYVDYLWVLGPAALEDLGEGLADEVADVFLGLSPDDPDDAELLELFGAGGFQRVDVADYAVVEETGRRLGLVQEP